MPERAGPTRPVLTIKAPAKINWFLHVTGKRPDGFHDILSLMQCVSLFDTLSFEPSAKISVECTEDIPQDTNLAFRAALLMKERYKCSDGALIRLEKNIPLAAGLGGGSSDAATTLLGLNELWGLQLGLGPLMDLAAGLGSDVPFFISGGPAIASGRGEILRPVLKGPSCAIALIKPAMGVSAGSAYADTVTYSAQTPTEEEIVRAATSDDLSSIKRLMRNTLEKAVLGKYPLIDDIKRSLLRNGALASLMSGSGSTVFGVFHDESAARGAVDTVRADLDTPLWSFVAMTI